VKTRVLMVLQGYPTISQTYMTNEVDALKDGYELRIISTKHGDLPGGRHHPFEVVTEKGRMRDIIEEFRPQVLHGHYLHTSKLLAELGERYRIPFTIRTHSFDSLKRWRGRPLLGRPEVHAVRSDACAGVLAFPFVRGSMESIGIPSAKIIDCYPVINYSRFNDRSPNGDAVLNVGACIPKKRMEDFVDLGKLVEKRFNIYAIGYEHDALLAYNQANGSPVTVHRAVEPHEMPAVYKSHGWLVYTADFKLKTVGWPMAVAEAQAAGLGVCFPNIRPDVREYVGGAGFLYNSITEAADIIRRPYPEQMREAGFEQSKKSDIESHKHLLTDVWDRVAGTKPRSTLHTSYRLYAASTDPLRATMRKVRGGAGKETPQKGH
jgi:hypothetical protein